MLYVKDILNKISSGDVKTLARAITIVENELEGYEEILKNLSFQKKVPIIGITGPPGAGKSTIINSILNILTSKNKKIGVIAIDPTSPFNYGSLLGDRLRMAEHFNNTNVFIRSLATRGSLGGLSAKTIEVVDVMRNFDFDYIFVETVGVGQSEVEIVGLADTTILVLVPESGDEVQTIKSGVMEIADIFVVNKADREGANIFSKNLHEFLHEKKQSSWVTPVIKSIATQSDGIDELIKKIDEHFPYSNTEKKSFLMTEKAFRLIQNKRMKGIDKKELNNKIIQELKNVNFNLYKFVESF